MTKPLGHHLLVDYFDCDSFVLTDTNGLESSFKSAILEAGGTIVTSIFHTFSPYGVSGVVVIAESHVALHTWPEKNIASVDIFSCSSKLNLDHLVALIKISLKSKNYSKRLFERGIHFARCA
jgi:S-adenosylmethionine decarboxylase proenzyme